jgi:hypothetical protein
MAETDLLLIPLADHITIIVLNLSFVIGILISSGLFASYVTFAHNAMLILTAAVVGALSVQTGSLRPRNLKTIHGKIYFRGPADTNITVSVLAALNLLAALFVVANYALGLGRCATYNSNQLLVDYIWAKNTSTIGPNATALGRPRNQFAMELLNFQLCMDEVALAVSYLVAVGLLIVLSGATLVYELLLTKSTRSILAGSEK